MSEFNAMLGIHQLNHMPEILEARGQRDQLYRQLLKQVDGIQCQRPLRQTQRNYAYFPIFVQDNFPLSRDELYLFLQKNGIYGRRYFYPLISEFPMYADMPSSDSLELAVAFKASRQVICLPLYPDLPMESIEAICGHIAGATSD